ncbi:4Fe-4S dicluster domain-containing protein [bacterium]|nr:4Fe-4S dicluster domain-containing protein [bacterium]
MRTLFITKKDWVNFLKGKLQKSRIYAPFEFEDKLFYSPVSQENLEDIVYNRVRPVEPLKIFLYPFKERVVPEIDEVEEIIVMGAASCDVRGIEILDKVFMEGDYVDPNYKKRREKLLIISFDCQQPYPTCFCEKVGIHPYPEKNFDINISKLEEGFIVEIGSEKGEAFVGNDQRFFEVTEEQKKKRDALREEVSKKVQENNKEFDFENINERMKDLYETEIWKNLPEVENCVACGSCTANCPTCVCFLLEDTGTESVFKKIRVWDSCLYPGYARMASGATPRPTLYDRYGNRFLCKYSYMVSNFGILGCTGCGRCITGCIGKIDKRKVIAEVLKEKV